MQFTYLELFDLFLRFMGVGQLSVLSLYALSINRHLKSYIACTVALCLSAYLLLTAPIENEHYGFLRGILLFFTELAPYIIWYFAYLLIKGDLQFYKWRRSINLSIVLLLIWFLYFFGYLQGRGTFHQINHALQLVPLVHIIYLSLKDLSDDLVNARRNTRIIFVMSVSFYFVFILFLELSDSSLRASEIFSAVNASIALVLTTLFSWYFFNGLFVDETPSLIEVKESKYGDSSPVIPPVFKKQHLSLLNLMESGFYLKTQLSIKELSSELSIPEHQLRELINKHLGYRNFSDFLNSYRLPNACSQLEDINNLRKPILTIALELGYGSVATFNRAFKAKTGKTPKEYRSYFQK